MQALENARASGWMAEGRAMEDVHLDDLPAYEEPPSMGQPSTSSASRLVDDTANYGGPPAGPPPGYEEVQRESVATELQKQYEDGSR